MLNLVFIILVIVIPFYAYVKRDRIERMIKKKVTEIKKEESFTSYLIFIAIVVFVNLIFYSSTIPNLMSGYLYGLYKGSILTLIGCIISSAITFYIGKNSAPSTLFKKGIFKNFYKKMTTEGISPFKKLELVILSRLSPIAPFQAFTFFWSFVNMDFLLFIIGSTIGIIPALVLDTYIGTKLDSLENIIDSTVTLKNLPIEKIALVSLITIILAYMTYYRIKHL